VLKCALEKLEVHVVVVRDRTAGSTIFALDDGALPTSRSPDTTAKALSDASVLGAGF
jgi:hypothetical protein